MRLTLQFDIGKHSWAIQFGVGHQVDTDESEPEVHETRAEVGFVANSDPSEVDYRR